jgi:hypothetical protein
MLYCVSYVNGLIGVFSSIDKIKELISNKYPFITFIIQVFKNSDNMQLIENKHIVWIVTHLESDTYLYVSDSKTEVDNIFNIFNKVKKPYKEKTFEILEQEVNVLSENTEKILYSINMAHKSNNENIPESSIENIVFYAKLFKFLE